MNRYLLIADADGACCKHYCEFFGKHGFEVETCAGGLECLEKLRQRTPDALLLDLGLYWGGGEGVLAWLREENPNHGIPVILTASPNFAHDLNDFMQPPVVNYFPKPFALPVLLSSVRSAIARPKPRPSSKLPLRSELYIG